MAILRWLFITVFAFSFLHTSMLVGLLYKIPLAPQLYERHLEKSGKLWLLYPVRRTGRWASGSGSRLLSMRSSLISTNPPSSAWAKI